MNVGSSSSNGNDSNTKSNEIEDVSCLVKFRPCDDWHGEYGFDWVREGKQDYEEKIEIKTVGGGDRTRYSSYDFYSDKMSVEEFQQSRKNVEIASDIPPEIATDMLRTEWGDEKYEAWREEKRKALVGNRYDDANGKVAINDIRERAALEIRVDKMASLVIKNHPEYYDNSAWTSDDRIKIDKDSLREDDGVKPIEYAYAPKDVFKAVYRMNSWRFDDVWKCDVEYFDKANGSTEAENAPFRMEHFIQKVDTKLSMLKKDAGYAIPYYTEGSEVTLEGRGPAFQIYKEKSDGWYVIDRQHLDGIIALARKGYFDDGKRQIIKSGDAEEVKTLFEYPETAPLATYKKLEYKKGVTTVSLSYRRINGAVSAAVVLQGPNSRHQLYYENGCLKEVMRTKWTKLTDLPADVRNELVQEADKFITKDLAADTEQIDIVKVRDKIKDKSMDDVVFTLFYPKEIKEFQLPSGEMDKDKEGYDRWNKHRIISWLEAYEDTFSPFTVRMYKENEKQPELVKCLVPVLSISHDNLVRKRFTFNTALDAPKTEQEPDGKYTLQLRFEGDSKKLKFVSDQPDSITVDPEIVENPKSKDKIKITVNYSGKYVPDALIRVKDITQCSSDDAPAPTVGKLKVKIHKTKTFRILEVKVSIGGEGLSQKYEDSLSDQYDCMNNILGQVGIKTIILPLTLDVDASVAATFMKDDKINGNVTYYDDEVEDWLSFGDVILKAFVKKFGEKMLPVLSSSVPFFYVDKALLDCSAFQSTSQVYNCDYEVFGNSLSYNRARIYVLAHETLHALENPHSFQLNCEKRYNNPFCFPLQRTSNIMDYSGLEYSLHKYQWDTMETGMAHYMSKAINSPNVRKQIAMDRRMKEKKDRVFGNKMEQISKGFSLDNIK